MSLCVHVHAGVPRDRGVSDKLGLGWQFVSYHLSDRKVRLILWKRVRALLPMAPPPPVFAVVVLNSTYYRGGEEIS